MNVSSVSSQSLIAELLAIQNSEQTQTASAADLLSSGSDQTRISGPGAMMSQLQQLLKSDPEKFKEAAQEISDKLDEEAENADDPRKAQFLSEMSAKFAEAADSGDMSALAPPPPPRGQKGDGSGVAGGYGKDGRPKLEDLFSDVNSVISEALASVLGSTSALAETQTVDAVA